MAVSVSEPNTSQYLSLVERSAAVGIPIIASLNAITAGGWTHYASALEQAGAAAIELNIYHLPDDPLISGRDVEKRTSRYWPASRQWPESRSRSS